MTYTTAELVQAEIRATSPFSTSTYPSLAQLTTWIAETDSHINKIAGRTYAGTEYTETLDYSGEGTITLENAPIISVGTFNYATVPLGDASYPSWVAKTEDTHFTVYNNTGVVELLYGNFTPCSGNKRFQITYTAGYITPPAYIQMLATKLVAKHVIDSVLQKDVNEKQSGKSISVGSISIVKPSDFGVSQYRDLKSDIENLKMELVKGKLNYRYSG